MAAANLHRRLRQIIGQVNAIDKMVDEDIPVSYTHLDVYKRQPRPSPLSSDGRHSHQERRQCARGTYRRAFGREEMCIRDSWKEARNLYYIIMNRPEAAKLRIQLDLDPITMM